MKTPPKRGARQFIVPFLEENILRRDVVVEMPSNATATEQSDGFELVKQGLRDIYGLLDDGEWREVDGTNWVERPTAVTGKRRPVDIRLVRNKKGNLVIEGVDHV